MIVIEFDKKFHRPGRHFDRIDGKIFWRIWGGWFAITYTQFCLKGLHDYIAEGNTVWRIIRLEEEGMVGHKHTASVFAAHKTQNTVYNTDCGE